MLDRFSVKTLATSDLSGAAISVFSCQVGYTMDTFGTQGPYSQNLLRLKQSQVTHFNMESETIFGLGKFCEYGPRFSIPPWA